MKGVRARAGLTLLLVPALAGLTALPSAATPSTVHVGTLTLTPCDVLPHALCGKLNQPWDRRQQSSGTIEVGFAFVPASDHKHSVVGTVVPHEGGPGYSTTASASAYADMYGPLLKRRNMLLVDQRGTGRTAAINCPQLQDLKGAYAPAAAACAKHLGSRADLYGSADSADDLAAVVTALGLGHIDLYGDSYGTFFAQTFAGRHPAMLRSLVLDGAYPTTGETQWYPTQGPAMLRSIDLVCARTPSCKALGASTGTLLQRVLAKVRHASWRGIGPDADGVRHHVAINASALVSVAFGATYGPSIYRELPGPCVPPSTGTGRRYCVSSPRTSSPAGGSTTRSTTAKGSMQRSAVTTIRSSTTCPRPLRRARRNTPQRFPPSSSTTRASTRRSPSTSS